LALRPEPLLLEACRTAILPAPLSQRHTYGDSTAWFDAAETPAGWLRLGLAHGSVQGILAESMVDATNPIAPDRAARARLDYLALGDWHGGKRIETRCWYSGTPEPDRFKANDSGQALLVEIDAPGAEPRVQALRTAQFDWLELSASLRVASDLDGLLQRLQGLPAHTVLSLQLEGQLALDLHQRLNAALAVLRGRLRHLSVEASALSLAPTDEDIAALQADGYLAEVIAELRELGAAGTAPSSDEPGEAEIAREALALLTATLAQRRTELSA
ncbi:MAG: DNA repair exonuclease, partial [Paucibacter sp.]|nr:DNA repair exonuclease [Roseateles sp.]